jgi:uncharacterized protein (DUF302 family)
MTAQANVSPSGVVTLPSPYSLAETLRRLAAAIHGKGLTLFADIDQQAAARKVDLAMPGTHLVLFGNPRTGTPVMIEFPEAGLDLPLKALVWEDGRGKVWLSYNSPSYLATRHALPGALATPLAAIEPLLASVVKAVDSGETARGN